MERSFHIILPYTKKIDDLSINDYESIFTKIVGTGIKDIVLYQKELNSNNLLRRGGSIWTFLGNLAKKSLPLISKIFLPEAVNFGQSLLERQNRSANISKQDLKDLSKKSLKNII